MNINILGIYRQDLSTKEIQVYNHNYNPDRVLIVPQQAISFDRKEDALNYLKNELGINPETFVGVLSDKKTIVVDSKILEAVIEEIPEEILD